MSDFNLKRVRRLNNFNSKIQKVVYWMSRDQRLEDNYALEFASILARQNKAGLAVVFCLDENFAKANFRHFKFMLQGLLKLQKQADLFNLKFEIISGSADKVLPNLLKTNQISSLVTDFSPLKIKQSWLIPVLDFCNKNEISIFEVDAHNIVPAWVASDKEEYGARTIRNKINSKLGEFLLEQESLQIVLKNVKKMDLEIGQQVFKKDLEIEKFLTGLKSDDTDLLIKNPIKWIKSGYDEAKISLQYFLENGLQEYATLRNDPNQKAQSNLSPYLHFGQVSSQRIALEVKKKMGNIESEEAFLEELIVRKELGDNFCFYNPNYDNSAGFKEWARNSLDQHLGDERDFLYSIKEFEQAKTHDPLWNAAQVEMVKTGKMHGFMRMYWAKKILEWTKNYNEAMQITTLLNDKYFLDGRDPNGYTGIAWSIGGIHDRAWFERQIFGKIRYMNYNGCKRKFDVDKYISSNPPLATKTIKLI